MRKKINYILLWSILFLAIAGQSAFAQEENEAYFAEKGHYIKEEFYDFYFANPNAETLYGRPITEAITDPKTGILIQYFENVRFEYHPEDPPGENVQITPVGEKLYQPGIAIENLTASTPNCHQESDWDYPICFSFLSYYDHFGGELQFGKPVSGLEYTRGRLVQHLEYAKLTWMPDNPDQARIIIAPLGYSYFYATESDLTLLDPIKNFEYNQSISEVRVRAFPKNAILENGSAQMIDIIAVDQNNAPLTNGLVEVTMRFPDNTETTTTDLIQTDNFGLANIALTTISDKPGVVEVIVRVTYNEIEGFTITSFRIWY